MSSTSRHPTATERLADYIVGQRFEDLPGHVVAKAKELLVHHMGLALRGVGTDHGRKALSIACTLSGHGAAFTLIGDRRKANLLEAVFATPC